MSGSKGAAMVAAIGHFTETIEKLRDEHGWSESTYLEVMNAGKQLNDANGVLYVSSAAMDQTLGTSLVNELMREMWSEGNEEEPVEEMLTKRPFNMEISEEEDLLCFSACLITAFRRDLTRYALSRERLRADRRKRARA